MSAEKQGKRRVVLIGDPSSKRSVFFRKAADSLGIEVQAVPWDDVSGKLNLERLQGLEEKYDAKGLRKESGRNDWKELPGAAVRSDWKELPEAAVRSDWKELPGAAVKIDPPAYQTIELCRMQEQLKEYQRNLYRLAQTDCCFLNPPETICGMLDKRETNLRLKAHGVPVTEMFPEEVRTAMQLEEIMEQRNCYSVFVKPRYFSGAAGVAAFRIHPGMGCRKLYTSCRLEQGQLINTKRLVCLEENAKIKALLNQLLSLECVVERWHPKADFRGKSYDLRVVFQFGHIAAMVARQSKGPITNLHLNNQALDVEELGLGETAMDQIASVCRKAYEAFSGSGNLDVKNATGSGNLDVKNAAGSGNLDVKNAAGSGIWSAGNASGGISMAGIDLLLEKGSLRPRVIEMNGQGDLIYRDIYGENRIYQEQARVLAGLE